jgi:hypothetical protein
LTALVGAAWRSAHTLAVVVPWTQYLELSWAPELHFFEVRTELLREFEASECLTAFRWADNLIGARLDGTTVLEMQPFGLRVLLAAANGDRSVAEAAVARALGKVGPKIISVDLAVFQFLGGLSGPYDQARRTSASSVLGRLGSSAGVTDWAVLLDGTSERIEAAYQVEFGVLDDVEAPSRLTKQRGRMATSGAFPPVPSDFWRLDEVPPVALFMDWSWRPSGTLGKVASASGVLQTWGALSAECDQLSTIIYNSALASEAGRKETG